MIEFSSKCIRYIYFVMLRERSGNFGMMTALLLPVLLVTAGGTTDIYSAYNQKQQMQVRLDSAVMAAAQEIDADKQKQMAVNFMTDFSTASMPRARP
jgi:Flp pilus assembly protein TadG